THDNKPLHKLWEETFERQTSTSEQARFELTKIAHFAGLDQKTEPMDFEKEFYPAVMEALFKSESWIAIVMITDLLARKYRFNVPGTAANLNLTRRMQRSVAQLRASPRECARMHLIRVLLQKTGRA